MEKGFNENIKEITELLLSNNNAFICYRLPNNTEVFFNIFKDDQIKEINAEQSYNKGFLLYPFSYHETSKPLLLNPEIEFSNIDIPSNIEELSRSYFISSKPFPSKDNSFININKSEYKDFVSNAVDIIKSGDIDKIVLSRQTYIKEYGLEKAADYINELIKKYDSAFVYFIHIPGRLAWMGATPELFLSGSGQNFNTVSLAGTIRNINQDNIEWGDKEIEEQKIVSNFIEGELKKLNVTGLSKEGPDTISTGNLFHLQTRYNFDYDFRRHDIFNLIHALHPTPAVSGYPKEKSIKLINSLEPNNRQYYGGIIGKIDPDSNTNLFVNLRCLQFIDNGCILYGGGGITIDSDPEKEWDETCYKIQTLLSVLEKI